MTKRGVEIENTRLHSALLIARRQEALTFIRSSKRSRFSGSTDATSRFRRRRRLQMRAAVCVAAGLNDKRARMLFDKLVDVHLSNKRARARVFALVCPLIKHAQLLFVHSNSLRSAHVR